ncbi:MAG: type IV pilus assembly protein PilM [Candidatus Magasanikbacteria bacterium]|nr:type IV pilus assembly protein PilM [Candidatus Magasanikbacteria bacterium]
MLLTNPFAGAFGLDIGDLSLKLVQLSYLHLPFASPRFRVTAIRTATLPPGYIVNGEIQQPEMVRHKILHLLGRDGVNKPIKSRWVVTALPDPKTFLKLITLEIPAEELTEDDVLYQAKRHLPFDLSEAYLDWQIVPEDSTESATAVLIGAAPKVIADSYTYLLESAGLEALTLEVEAVAIARTLITRGKTYEGEARALLDLGATRTGLVIYDRGSLQFATTLNFSGELLTTALAQELKIGYEQAEKLKIEHGLYASGPHPRYLKAVTPLAEALAADLQRAFTFYREHFPAGNPIMHLTMCGGVSHLKNLSSLLSAKLKISAAPGNAWKNLNHQPVTAEEHQRGAALVTALGLALRAAETPVSSAE